MAEATAVVEEVIATPASTVETPVSPSIPEPPSTEETPSVETGTETLDTGESKDAPPKPLAEWTLAELDAKESLTSAERDQRDLLRDRVRQSESDRRIAEQRRIAEADAAQRAEVQRLTTAYDTTLAKIAEEQDALVNLNRDPELVKERITRYMDELREQSTAIAQAPLHARLNQALLHPDIFGDSVENRRAVGAMTVEEKIHQLMLRTEHNARLKGPTEGHVVLSTKELTAKEKAAADKALDDFKAANPQYASDTRGAQSAVGGWTYDRYMQATAAERRNIPPEVEAQLIRAESRRRAVRS